MMTNKIELNNEDLNMVNGGSELTKQEADAITKMASIISHKFSQWQKDSTDKEPNDL